LSLNGNFFFFLNSFEYIVVWKLRTFWNSLLVEWLCTSKLKFGCTGLQLQNFNAYPTISPANVFPLFILIQILCFLET